ncbi:MAG: RidA family protein [Proteobacteria bacterium]|nr:RidA family protein [Pseudomonadota bacterium]
MAGKIDARLKELGIELPEAPSPVANYVPFVRVGSLLFLAGQIPLKGGKLAFAGKVGGGLSLAEGQQAARLCALNALAQAKAACGGDLDRVRRCVKLTGFIASGPEFTDHAKVMNAASDLMVAVFGDAGRHGRTSVGAPSLPLDAAVEVEAVFEIA